jgi:peptidyl-prolyl cis-trans isomerase D
MLISKFNRIIRSRLVWTILGGIFALSLVVFIGPNTGCGTTANTGSIEGTLNGKPVASYDFRMARSFELRMRESKELSEDQQAKLRQRVWARIAALQAAESMGITVSDEEVATVIQRDPSFVDKRKGVFDKDLYARIILDQLHVGVETFELFLRQDMILRKMHQVMQSSVWSPPSEVTAKLNSVTDVLTVQGVFLRRSKLTPPPMVAQEDARRLFDERPEVFRIPDKRAVRYVRFPIEEAEQPAPGDEEIRAFYDANADKYASTDTNGPVTIPIEQVRGEIVSNLVHRAAVGKARERAMAFVLDMQPEPGRFGRAAKSFDALAAANSLQLQTSRLFSAHDRLPEFKAGPDFAKRAFSLDPDGRDQSVSDPVLGETAVFVMALHTNIESRLPDFTEVSDRAMRLARDRKQSELFQAKCAEIRKAVADGVGAGKSFDDAVSPFGLVVTNFPTFSLYNPNEEEQTFEHADAVKPAVMSLQKGEASDVVPMEDDALLVFMKDRKPGDLLSAEMLRPELTARINGYRANLVFSDWQDYLLKVGALDDQAIKAQERAKEPSN